MYKENPKLLTWGVYSDACIVAWVERKRNMDFSSHPLSRQSTIDRTKKLKQSTIDYQVSKYRTLLKDPTLGAGLVAEALMKLSESEIDHIADYAVRKGTHPGKVFVTICNNAMREKGAK